MFPFKTNPNRQVKKRLTSDYTVRERQQKILSFVFDLFAR